MKKILIFLVAILACQSNLMAEWSLKVSNVETDAANSASPGEIIKVLITKTGNEILPPRPFYLILNDNLLNEIKAFHIDSTDQQSWNIFFRLNEPGIVRMFKEVDAVRSIEVKLDLADKSKKNFTQVQKPNFKLKIPKHLVLVDSSVRLDGRLEVKVANLASYEELPQNREELRIYFDNVVLNDAKALGASKVDSIISFSLDGSEVAKEFYENVSTGQFNVGVSGTAYTLVKRGENNTAKT